LRCKIIASAVATQPPATLVVDAEIAKHIAYEAPQLIPVAGHQRYRRDLAVEDDPGTLLVSAGGGHRPDPFGLLQRRPEATQATFRPINRPSSGAGPSRARPPVATIGT
jgi:hypothetical protein